MKWNLDRNTLFLKLKNTKKIGIVVKKYEIIKPRNDEVDYIVDDVIETRINFFHTLEYRCMYDIKFTNMVIDEVINLTITPKYMSLRSEFYGLNKKIKNTTKIGFRINEIMKLTKKLIQIYQIWTFIFNQGCRCR